MPTMEHRTRVSPSVEVKPPPLGGHQSKCDLLTTCEKSQHQLPGNNNTQMIKFAARCEALWTTAGGAVTTHGQVGLGPMLQVRVQAAELDHQQAIGTLWTCLVWSCVPRSLSDPLIRQLHMWRRFSKQFKNEQSRSTQDYLSGVFGV